NPVIGNPNLKIPFTHLFNVSYRNYIANSGVGINIDLNTRFVDDRVIVNTIQVQDAYNSLIYERHYRNINGSYMTGGYYTVTKQLSNHKYLFTLSGNIDHQHDAGMSNNVKNISSLWTFKQKLGMKINPTEKFEVNPSVSYIYSTYDNNLP